MQHYQHQSASKSTSAVGKAAPTATANTLPTLAPGIVTDQLTLLCSSAGKQQQYGSIQNRTSPALLAQSPSPSSQCIVCLNTNLHHQVPTTATTSSSHLRVSVCLILVYWFYQRQKLIFLSTFIFSYNRTSNQAKQTPSSLANMIYHYYCLFTLFLLPVPVMYKQNPAHASHHF